MFILPLILKLVTMILQICLLFLLSVFLVDIPADITGFWYEGEVHVLYKDNAFEPSSSSRLAAELASVVQEKPLNCPVLFVYTDGGPDLRLTFASVKCTLIESLTYVLLEQLHITLIAIL